VCLVFGMFSFLNSIVCSCLGEFRLSICVELLGFCGNVVIVLLVVCLILFVKLVLRLVRWLLLIVMFMCFIFDRMCISGSLMLCGCGIL